MVPFELHLLILHNNPHTTKRLLVRPVPRQETPPPPKKNTCQTLFSNTDRDILLSFILVSFFTPVQSLVVGPPVASLLSAAPACDVPGLWSGLWSLLSSVIRLCPSWIQRPVGLLWANLQNMDASFWFFFWFFGFVFFCCRRLTSTLRRTHSACRSPPHMLRAHCHATKTLPPALQQAYLNPLPGSVCIPDDPLD